MVADSATTALDLAESKPKNSSKVQLIIGASIGGAVVLSGMVGTVLVWRKMKQRSRTRGVESMTVWYVPESTSISSEGDEYELYSRIYDC